ncbi:hypothetical protein JTE90_010083 [Oedothorax gibbosus]|uniref:CCHC-type domain-containing protein n=1 Tax=Oedothorax gibbosus TaxID=931172 RepID=A0AAV6U5H8_9ARAC|nr:hypothetical protein JTE90_010083 [Oedothorax gibbosus]
MDVVGRSREDSGRANDERKVDVKRVVVTTALQLSTSILTSLMDLVAKGVLHRDPRDMAVRHELDRMLGILVEQKRALERSAAARPPAADHLVVLVYPIRPSPPSTCSADTLSDLRTHIDIRAHGIRVVHTRSIRNSGVVVQLYARQDLDQFVNVFKAHPVVSQRYEVKIPFKLDPRVIVFEVDADETTLLKAIEDLVGGEDRRMQIVKKKRTARGHYHYVVSLDGDTFRRVMAEGHLPIDWALYNLTEYDMVKQCFRCGRFGHYLPLCRRERRCQRCGHPAHDGSPCDWPAHCINCHEKNLRDGSQSLPTNHVFGQRTCPVWQAEAQRFRECNIDYENTRKRLAEEEA